MPLEPQVTPTRLAPSERAVSTAVAASAIVQTFLAADVNRKGFTVYNAATGVLFLKLGTGASEASYTLQIAAGGYFETPFGYVGAVTGVWAVGSTGFATVTEVR